MSKMFFGGIKSAFVFQMSQTELTGTFLVHAPAHEHTKVSAFDPLKYAGG